AAAFFRGGTVRIKQPIGALSSAAALCAALSSAQAQERNAGPGAQEEIIVTSTRGAKNLADVPASISVVSEAEIQLGQQQLTLDESLVRVPGVFMQNRH